MPMSVMPHSRLMPSLKAIQQAVREPMTCAPHDHNGIAIYVFARAREIDHEKALTKKLAQQVERPLRPRGCAGSTGSLAQSSHGPRTAAAL